MCFSTLQIIGIAVPDDGLVELRKSTYLHKFSWCSDQMIKWSLRLTTQLTHCPTLLLPPVHHPSLSHHSSKITFHLCSPGGLCPSNKEWYYECRDLIKAHQFQSWPIMSWPWLWYQSLNTAAGFQSARDVTVHPTSKSTWSVSNDKRSSSQEAKNHTKKCKNVKKSRTSKNHGWSLTRRLSADAGKSTFRFLSGSCTSYSLEKSNEEIKPVFISFTFWNDCRRLCWSWKVETTHWRSKHKSRRMLLARLRLKSR